MTANNKAKLKLLYIYRMLEEETDPEHGLTMGQIIERLEEEGVQAERKGVYRDIQVLREFGLDIQLYQRSPAQYALARRDFTLSELSLLVDAVESSRFLTRRQANTLVGNIKSLASLPQQGMLDRRIHVEGRISSKAESVFEAIDVIHEALRRKRRVSFKYFRFGPDGTRYATHYGARREVTPVGISYDGGFYYLTAWNEQYDEFREYRVDRMGALRVSEEPATRNEKISSHVFTDEGYEYFSRFDGPRKSVTFAVHPSKVEILLDRFGEHVTLRRSNGEVLATTKVRVSPQFFGWLAGLNGEVVLTAPKALLDEYHGYLRGLIGGEV